MIVMRIMARVPLGVRGYLQPESLETRAWPKRVSVHCNAFFCHPTDSDDAFSPGRFVTSLALGHDSSNQFAEGATIGSRLLSSLIAGVMLIALGAHQGAKPFDGTCHELAPVATVLCFGRIVLVSKIRGYLVARVIVE